MTNENWTTFVWPMKIEQLLYDQWKLSMVSMTNENWTTFVWQMKIEQVLYHNRK